ncbi:SufE family protein [Aurantimicrobium minutum]|jgi:cysteine desulfuration protein SufE|uniref:Fe-S metabolism associated SufE n=1 Tax=Aurantimicrobium minutum TaxID=708131 RepID=A0A173LW05_9MICO|nr:SufE family protein [Aurantimicrobium minutum]MDH6239339.1 cysteine desulfuration protein SufE [Aurantimicrobium minutum]BAU99038.1 Fe-S metabolism associated SufE [Aurantimicrobium minutum]
MTELPQVLAQTQEDFLDLGDKDKIQLLIEFAEELPALPSEYQDHPELLEKVEECQSPVYIFVDVHDGRVAVHATAPEQAPTTRGFASILVQGLTGLTVQEALDIPDDFPSTLGLNALISPLRVRGMTGMLWRMKRQIREKSI